MEIRAIARFKHNGKLFAAGDEAILPDDTGEMLIDSKLAEQISDKVPESDMSDAEKREELIASILKKGEWSDERKGMLETLFVVPPDDDSAAARDACLEVLKEAKLVSNANERKIEKLMYHPTVTE